MYFPICIILNNNNNYQLNLVKYIEINFNSSSNKSSILKLFPIFRKHKKTKKENGESKLKDKKKSNGDHVENGKQKRPPSPSPSETNKKKKVEASIITEINLNEEEMNLEELIKQKVYYTYKYMFI